MCTDDLRYSLSITVVDADGAAVTDATGVYSVDGGPQADCQGAFEGKVTCGAEGDGEISVTISAPGFEDHSFTEAVAADECHVINEEVEVTLTAAG